MKRILVRAKSHFSLVAVMKDGGFLEREGLDPQFEVERDPAVADGELKAGTTDLIFGSHVTPYVHYDDGEPWVYLAQTMNAVREYFGTREEIHGLSEMRGKRIAIKPLYTPEGKFGGHPRGNRELMLRRAGIADTVDTVGNGPTGRSADRFQAVADGHADGTFVGRQDLRSARAAGLRIMPLESLPMIYFVTVTTTYRKVQEHQQTGSFERLLRALSGAAGMFKTNPEATLKILENWADFLGYEDDQDMRERYESEARTLDPRLIPQTAAIDNAFRLAQMIRPDIADRVNPLGLWDLHFVRAMHEAAKDK
jgi:ABC-type nitrate/sulfonate/bicarbonate transport system substrate-binding protein